MKKKLKRILRKSKFIIFNIKKPSYYAENGRKLMKDGDIDKSLSVLDKGLHYYPNSLLINKEYAILKMTEETKGSSIKHWNKVFKSKKNELLKKEDYLLASDVYKNKKDKTQFINFINKSTKVIKEDMDIKEIKIKFLFELSKFNEITKIIESTYATIIDMPINIRILLAKSYRNRQLYEKADYLLRESLKNDKENSEIALQYAEVAVEQKKWRQAIERYEYAGRLLDKEVKFEIYVKIAMIYKVVGEHLHAKNILENAPESIKEDLLGHELITLFDNGKSRIEYYKQKKQTDKVVIVFDSLHMDWKGEPFGFKLLSRQNIDIIAVRKKYKGTYQQDLSQGDFIHTLEKLVDGYEDKIAYGHSLGGYLSLYYASNLNCRILSLAPRLSIHPKFGRENFIEQFEFNHNQSNKYNNSIRPIVVYDPKSKVDNKYVTEEVLVQFPNAKLVKMPYGGHGIARHLLRMGVLKDFILNVIDGENPTYNRSLKCKSANYYRLLGRECLKRNKMIWASKMAKKAVELLPNDRYVIKFQLDVFRNMEQYDKAITFMKDSIKLAPKNLHVRIFLIDLYIEIKNYYQAEFELNKVIQLLGAQKALEEKLDIIDTLRSKEIEQPLNFIEEN